MPESETAPPRLELRGLTVELGGRPVLRGIDLELHAGEILGLLGPNGAGKTTVFRILTGLLEPSGGTLLLDGRAVRPGARSFRARCGIVFQDPALDPRLSARKNLELSARLYGYGRREAAGRIERALERIRLADRADEPVAQFSGGMRRRVELARALIHQPSILVLDEPTTGLDEGAFRSFWKTLLELRKSRGLTLLLTTHRADEAECCDRIAFVDGGRVVACDAPDELRARVRGDLVVLDAEDPKAAGEILATRLDVRTTQIDGKLLIRRERAHELIPRIVESLPEGALHSVSLRRTGLGEVFLELTGHELEDEPGGES